MLQYKENFDETKQYFEAFWQKEVIDRPLLSITCPKDPRHPATPVPYMSGSFDGKWLETLQAVEQFFSGMEYSIGEAIPTWECSYGPDEFGAFLGAKLEKGNGTSWVHPFLDSFEGYKAEIDRSPDGVYTNLMKYIRFASDYAKDKFLIGALDFHSHMDALSAIRSPEELCADLILDEDHVGLAMEQVRKLFPVVYEDMYRAGNFAETGMIGWAPTYCKGRFATIQCDFICMVSREMARKFIIPAIREEAEYLDHCVYHYDGSGALRHIDDILAIEKIDCIQWIPGAGNPRSVEWMDLLHKIQSAGKGLWLCDWTVEEVKTHFKELKPEGVIYQVNAADPKEAEDLVQYVKNHM